MVSHKQKINVWFSLGLKNDDNADILYQLLIKIAKDNIDIYKIKSVNKTSGWSLIIFLYPTHLCYVLISLMKWFVFTCLYIIRYPLPYYDIVWCDTTSDPNPTCEVIFCSLYTSILKTGIFIFFNLRLGIPWSLCREIKTKLFSYIMFVNQINKSEEKRKRDAKVAGCTSD